MWYLGSPLFCLVSILFLDNLHVIDIHVLRVRNLPLVWYENPYFLLVNCLKWEKKSFCIAPYYILWQTLKHQPYLYIYMYLCIYIYMDTITRGRIRINAFYMLLTKRIWEKNKIIHHLKHIFDIGFFFFDVSAYGAQKQNLHRSPKYHFGFNTSLWEEPSKLVKSSSGRFSRVRRSSIRLHCLTFSENASLVSKAVCTKVS